ncbi:MAG: hypothetical protein SWY16_23475 [Cyanobacteriota bacterium]|nr:hypothetical protein [Cyanobacteriota bacterium]
MAFIAISPDPTRFFQFMPSVLRERGEMEAGGELGETGETEAGGEIEESLAPEAPQAPQAPQAL